MPTTLLCGRPDSSRITHTITSSGLVTTMTKALGQCCLMFSATVATTLALMPIKSSRAHARLARHAGGDDHHVGALQRAVVVRADIGGVETLDRRHLRDVERLALRHAVDDVEQHDIAQLLDACEQCQRATDLAGADQRDLVASHGNLDERVKPGAERARRGDV